MSEASRVARDGFGMSFDTAARTLNVELAAGQIDSVETLRQRLYLRLY